MNSNYAAAICKFLRILLLRCVFLIALNYNFEFLKNIEHRFHVFSCSVFYNFIM